MNKEKIRLAISLRSSLANPISPVIKALCLQSGLVMPKKKFRKHKILEPVVFRSGIQYQEAAMLLEQSNLWVACINASLSVEIYLKSFLITNREIQGYPRFMSTTHKSHDLLKLFKKINPKDKSTLLAAVKQISPEMDLLTELTRYRNVFTNARYTFEPSNVESMGNRILILANVLKEAITLILEENYPVKKLPHLEKAVIEMLYKK